MAGSRGQALVSGRAGPVWRRPARWPGRGPRCGSSGRRPSAGTCCAGSASRAGVAEPLEPALGPATSLLAQNRAKSGDSWASRAGRVVQAGSSRWTVIAARYMATCRAASPSQSAIRVRQWGSVKPRCSMFAGPPGWAQVAEQQPGGPVVGQDVEPGRDGVRRGWFEARHQRVQPGTAGRVRRCALPAPGLVAGVAGECEQVPAFVGVQPERVGDRGQHTGRGPGLAALLQPRGPGQADVGELGDLFPAQTRDPPDAPVGQPHLGRAQPGAAGAQERAQLAAPVATAGGPGRPHRQARNP